MFELIRETELILAVMEAIAAFGLACNILQVLDSANKVVCLGLEVYKNGVSADNAELEQASEHLFTLCTGLDSSLAATRSPPTTAADGEVRLLAAECSATIDKLKDVLQKLKSTGTRWNALLKTAQAVRTRAKIDKIGARVEKLQGLLNTSILVRLRYAKFSPPSSAISSR